MWKDCNDDEGGHRFKGNNHCRCVCSCAQLVSGTAIQKHRITLNDTSNTMYTSSVSYETQRNTLLVTKGKCCHTSKLFAFIGSTSIFIEKKEDINVLDCGISNEIKKKMHLYLKKIGIANAFSKKTRKFHSFPILKTLAKCTFLIKKSMLCLDHNQSLTFDYYQNRYSTVVKMNVNFQLSHLN